MKKIYNIFKFENLLLIIQFLLIILTFVFWHSRPSIILLISEIILLLICIFMREQFKSVFSPFSIFIIACDISFTIKALNIIYINKFPAKDICTALIWYIIFILGFAMGIFFKNKVKIEKIERIKGVKPLKFIFDRSFDSKRCTLFFIIAIIISLGIYFYKLGTFDISSIFSNVLSNRKKFQNDGNLYIHTLIMVLLKSCFYICCYLVYNKLNEKYKYKYKYFFLTILFIILIFVSFSLGGRGEIIIPALTLLFIRERAGKNLNFKLLIVVVPIVLIFCGWYGMMRDGVKVTNGKVIQETTQNLLNRYVQLDNLIRLSSNPVEYKFGKSFVDFMYSPIPRSINKNKPYPFNSQMTKIYLPEQFERKIVSDFTAISELKLNFGYVGIYIGGFYFSILLLYLWKFFDSKKTLLFVLWYSFMILKPMSLLYGGLINSTANMTIILESVLVLGVWLMISKKEDNKTILENKEQSKKKKIMYVILNGSEYGGSEKHVVDIINNISKEDYEPYLICSPKNEIFEHLNEENKKNVYKINRGISSILKIYSISLKLKPDIIHAHAARAIVLTRFAYLLRKLTFQKGKLICTAHGWVLEYLKHKKMYEKAFLFMKKLDHKTLAVSKYSMDEMIEKGYKEDKMKYIYNGIDNEEMIKNAKLKKDLKKISYIGRFTNQKGIVYLMETIKTFRNSEIKFEIYGKGELKQYIEEVIKKEKLKNVELKGFLDAKEVKNVLYDTDALILPSIDEGFPYILVEAVSCGVPCIASNVGGVSEIIIDNKTGKLTEKKNVDSICKAIKEIEKGDISLLSQNCLKTAKKFSLKKMIEELEKIYRKC